MDATQPQFLDVGSGPERRRIAYLRQESKDTAKPSLIFLSGFNSNMRGVKAEAVANWAAGQGSAACASTTRATGSRKGASRTAR